MNELKTLFSKLCEDVKRLAHGNAVVAKSISVGDRHVIPLCELKLGFGGGGGKGEMLASKEGDGDSGQGLGVGGGAKATPVVVVIVENGNVRVQSIGR